MWLLFIPWIFLIILAIADPEGLKSAMDQEADRTHEMQMLCLKQEHMTDACKMLMNGVKNDPK
jgi:hypothetical protein